MYRRCKAADEKEAAEAAMRYMAPERKHAKKPIISPDWVNQTTCVGDGQKNYSNRTMCPLGLNLVPTRVAQRALAAS